MGYIKLMATLFLSLVCSSAMADWTKIENQSEHNDSIFYIDISTLRKSDDLVKMWILTDFKVSKERMTRGLDVKKYWSSKAMSEFNCKDETFRTTYTLLYSGVMATGEVIESDDVPGKWIPVVPGSISELLLKSACAKARSP